MSTELEKNLIQWIILSKLPDKHVLVVDGGTLKVRSNSLLQYVYRQWKGHYRSTTVAFLKELLEKNIELCHAEFEEKKQGQTRWTKRLLATMIEAFEKSIDALGRWVNALSVDDEFSAEMLLFTGRIQDRIDALKALEKS